jgi:phage-related protein
MDKTKTVIWIGSSKKDFMDLPRNVRNKMGYALYIAQLGDKHRDTKPLKGFGGASVMEIVEYDGNGTYRTIYTVEMKKAVFVLHAFQKKSKVGIKTSKQDIDLVEQRLKDARRIYKEWQESNQEELE